jgi:hypothetical protein
MMSWSTSYLLVFAAFAAPVDTVAVEIDASSIKPEGPGIRRQLGDKVTTALAKRGIELDEAAANRLRIEVRQPSFITYDVTFEVMVDGVVVEPGLERVKCERCPLARMDEAVLAKLPDAIALMERANEAKDVPPPPAKPDPVESEPTAEETIAPPSEPGSTPKERPSRWNLLGPVGISGIVVGTGGVIVVAAGAGMMLTPPTVKPDPGALEFDLHRDPERTGRALVGVGAAAAVVGGVLLAVDLTLLRQRRRQLTRLPRVGPSFGGIVIEGRF